MSANVAAVTLRLKWGKGSASKLTHVLVGKTWFLQDCWTEGDNSSPAVGRRSPSVPSLVHLFIGQLTKRQSASSERAGERQERAQTRRDPPPLQFCLGTDTPSLSGVCYKQSTKSSPHSRGGITQECEYMEAGFIGDDFGRLSITQGKAFHRIFSHLPKWS